MYTVFVTFLSITQSCETPQWESKCNSNRLYFHCDESAKGRVNAFSELKNYVVDSFTAMMNNLQTRYFGVQTINILIND